MGLFKQLMIFGKTGRQGRRNGNSGSASANGHSSRHFPPLAVRRAEQRGAAAWLGLCALPQSLRPPCCAPAWVTLFLWAFSRQGATGVPLCTTWDSVAGSGRAPRESVLFIGTQFSILYTSMYLETFRARADPGSELSHLGLAPPRDCDLGRFGPGQTWILGPGLRVGGRMR